MGRQTWTNAALGFFLLLLIFSAIPNWREPEKIKPQHLFNTQDEEIRSIKIIRHSEKIIWLEKQGQRWFLKSGSIDEPENHLADQQKIDRMLGFLETEVFKQFKVPTQELIKFELDKPRIAVLFNQTKISFGSVNLLTRHRYINIDSAIYTVSNAFYPYFIAAEEDYMVK